MDTTSQRLMMGAAGDKSEPMVLVFDTRLSSGTLIALPLLGEVNVRVDWGDGTSSNYTTQGVYGKIYSVEGEYTVTISGKLQQFGNGSGTYTGADKLVRVEKFGLGVTSLAGAFRNAINLTSVPSSIPESVTNLSYCFMGATSFDDNNVTNWDVSNVVATQQMFYGATSFNRNIGNWNVGNVLIPIAMFFEATSFNQNIGNWNTSKFVSTALMFYGASLFNNGGSDSINNWQMGNVTDMSYMFYDAFNFNQPINAWNTSKVTNMTAMFYAGDVNTNFHRFNRPLIGWDTSKVTNMSFMFRGARAFNQEINSWDVSNVTNMQAMFFAATGFNRDLGVWDVSKVTNMTAMFQIALTYNQDLSGWCVSNFSEKPPNWDTDANPAWIAKPVWGTCPLDQYNLIAFFDPETIYTQEIGLTPNLTRLKWTGQNIQSQVFYQLYLPNGVEVVTDPNSSTTGQSVQNISATGFTTNQTWLAGKVMATSTIDGSQVVAYGRINILAS